MSSPLRYWRTGTVAVVMAALGQAGPSAGRGTADERHSARRQSPYGVAETVQRIESSAREHGMAVFASSGRGAAPRLIVLESADGGTPVLMHREAPERLELPLSLIVRLGGDARAEVLSGARLDWEAMPDAMALDLADLTEVVSAALRLRMRS